MTMIKKDLKMKGKVSAWNVKLRRKLD